MEVMKTILTHLVIRRFYILYKISTIQFQKWKKVVFSRFQHICRVCSRAGLSKELKNALISVLLKDQ